MDHLDSTSEELARREDARGNPPVKLNLFDEVIPPDNPMARYIAAAIALVLCLVSFFVVAKWAGSPDTYADIIASLDEKRDTVMRLVAGSTGTSAAITLLPGDVGTPIAEKLLDLGSDFAIVIGALYLEKYMLTILGLAAFKILIPAGTMLFAIAALIKDRTTLRQLLYVVSARLALFGLAIFLVVPASVAVSSLIEATYESTMTETLEAMEKSMGVEDIEVQTEEEPKSGFDTLVQFVQEIPENISEAATGVSEEVQSALNHFIETLAVMIVTSCVIPILVLLFFLWLAKTILGVNIEVPITAIRPRSTKKHSRV